MTRPTAEQARYRAELIAVSHYIVEDDRRTGMDALADLRERAAKALTPDDRVAMQIALRHEERLSAARPHAESAAVFDALEKRCDAVGDALANEASSARSLRAQYVRKSGRPDEGIVLYKHELRRRERVDREGYGTCLARGNLAVALREQGRLADLSAAAKLIEDDIAIREERWGPDHAFTWVAWAIKAQIHMTLSDISSHELAVKTAHALAAEALAADVAERRSHRLGSQSGAALRAVRLRARALTALGQAERAVWMLQRVRARERAASPITPGRTALHLAEALRATGDPRDHEEARGLAREAADHLREHGTEFREAERAAALLADLDGAEANLGF